MDPSQARRRARGNESPGRDYNSPGDIRPHLGTIWQTWMYRGHAGARREFIYTRIIAHNWKCAGAAVRWGRDEPARFELISEPIEKLRRWGIYRCGGTGAMAGTGEVAARWRTVCDRMVEVRGGM